MSMSAYLETNGVDARTAEMVSKTIATMSKGSPEKFLLAAQLAVAAAAGPGGLKRPGKIRAFEGWPCKWYVPELDSDQSGVAVREVAKNLAGMS